MQAFRLTHVKGLAKNKWRSCGASEALLQPSQATCKRACTSCRQYASILLRFKLHVLAEAELVPSFSLNFSLPLTRHLACQNTFKRPYKLSLHLRLFAYYHELQYTTYGLEASRQSDSRISAGSKSFWIHIALCHAGIPDEQSKGCPAPPSIASYTTGIAAKIARGGKKAQPGNDPNLLIFLSDLLEIPNGP